jgi:hypothetical protein
MSSTQTGLMMLLSSSRADFFSSKTNPSSSTEPLQLGVLYPETNRRRFRMFSSKSYGLFEMALSGKTSATCGWLRGAGHPGAGRSPISGQFPEQIFPDSAPRPAHKSVADRRRWATGRTITPATAAFQPMPNATDDATIVPAQPRRHPSASKAQIRSTAHRSAKTHSCSQFQFLPAKQSLSCCQRF